MKTMADWFKGLSGQSKARVIAFAVLVLSGPIGAVRTPFAGPSVFASVFVTVFTAIAWLIAVTVLGFGICLLLLITPFRRSYLTAALVFAAAMALVMALAPSETPKSLPVAQPSATPDFKLGQQEQEQRRQHEQRLAWQKAHPTEYQAQLAKQRREAAERERQANLDAQAQARREAVEAANARRAAAADTTAPEVHTIANAKSQRSTLDWPCFADKGEFEVWMANSGDSEETIEQNNALWLEPGDKVSVLQTEMDGEALKLRIISSPAAGEGKTCWTLRYEGYLFSN